jgi:hypothetical protein
LFSNFLDLIFSGELSLVDIATFSCFNQDFSTLLRKTFSAFTFSKSTLPTLSFSVGIPSWVGLSGPQLAAVSGLFGWESLNGWDFLGHNLLLSQASLGGNPSVDGIF